MRLSTAALLTAGASAAIAGDQVTSLPGWNGPLLSSLYSGYLTVPGGKHMHYMYSASFRSPAADPVVLWLNGGPGCSSLEGLLHESGAYHFAAGSNGSTLVANPYTWNNISNNIFLESPAGVGFSYADTPSGLIHNDSSTAADNLNALLKFFAGFPELRNNDFYIAGESYAGVYVPTLAYAIVNYNQNAPAGTKINLKGIMVGNGCLGTEAGVCGNDFFANTFDLDQWRGHGLMSAATFKAAYEDCGDWTNPTQQCFNDLLQASNEVNYVNIYDIYQPCINSGFNPAELSLGRRYARRPATKRDLGIPGPVECINAGDMTNWLNRPDVISALHVVSGLQWAVCSGNITYNPTVADERTVIYPTILQSGVRVLIYNGEADACVPWTDNDFWTRSMNYTVAAPWTGWLLKSDPNYLAGYVTQYRAFADGDFTFTTVRDAGHMVPETQPPAAWEMFNHFVNRIPWF